MELSDIKKITIFSFSFLFIVIFQGCTNKKNSETIYPVNLRCERMSGPEGVDIANPRLSWELTSGIREQKQTAYRVLVASSPDLLKKDKGDLWQSEKTESDQCIDVVYAGKPLESDMDCYWKVKVWDKDGNESGWSLTAHWSTGLLHSSDWKAKWIGLDKAIADDAPDSVFTRLSARMLRKEIDVAKKVKKARVYICGLGLFELYLNGEKASNDVLVPALSEYHKRSYYLTYDVTGQLKKGKNAIGVMLGNGRYLSPRNSKGHPKYDNVFPKLIFQLELEYSDGSKRTVISDESWKVTADGPITANNEYDGEKYDARKEMPGWNETGFDDASWMQVEPVAPASPELCAQPMEPIRIKDTVKPVSVNEVSPGVFIFDMGQNMVGWTTLKVKGERGQKIQMRFAETLKPDGNLYLDNLRKAQVTDTYILKGEGTEVYEPRFTYHGFRYVEMTGYPGKPGLSCLEGKVVYDDMATIGSFETSDKMVNTVYKNAYWGIRGNYRSIPTDCPQRDERQGWLGDRATGSKGESFIFDNSKLYAKWLQDIEDTQRDDGSVPDVAPAYWKYYSDNVTWPAAYLFIAEMLYNQFGDIVPIQKHYASFKKWIYHMKEDYLKDDILVKDRYGDWCMPPESQDLIHSKDPARKTDGAILSTTYYYHLLGLMQKFARLTGNDEDIEAYKQLADSVYKAYNNKYFDTSRKCYGNNTATANLLSLAYQLVPEEYRQDVFNNIVQKTMVDFNGHISTGLVGAQWIMRILSEYGRPDIALKLATNTTYPSWGYMAEHGATTIWELWNGDTANPAMNSGNHVMLLGDLVIWYYENLAGIKSDPDNVGFKKIIMNPLTSVELNFVKASYHSPYGLIKSEWEKKGNAFNWAVTVPVNTTAVIYIPANNKTDIKESGNPAVGTNGLQFLRMENGKAVFEAASGNYNFSSVF